VPPERTPGPSESGGGRPLRTGLRRLARSGTRAVRATLLAAVVALVGAVVGIVVNERRQEQRDRAVPFEIRIEQDLGTIEAEQPYNWTAYDFVIDRPVSKLPGPPGEFCRTWWSWGRGLGGVDAERTRLRVYVTGRSSVPVVLDRVEVHVRRNPPMEGLHPTCFAGGAVANPRHVAVDLDRGTARLDGGDAGEPFLFKLSSGDVEVFEINATTERCDCRWWLELGFVQGEDRRSAQLGDEEAPFRTTSVSRARAVRWTGARWTPLRERRR
jgi:hypothetical protein